VIVAQHAGKVLPLGTMRSIIAGSGLPLNECRNEVLGRILISR